MHHKLFYYKNALQVILLYKYVANYDKFLLFGGKYSKHYWWPEKIFFQAVYMYSPKKK